MIVDLLKLLYWPSLWFSTAFVVFTTLLIIYWSLSRRKNPHAPMPEARWVAVLGWLGFATLCVVLLPAVTFLEPFIDAPRLSNFAHDSAGELTGVSILEGTRFIARDDRSFPLFMLEVLLLAGLGSRGVHFAVMMWPTKPREPRVHVPQTRYDRG